ncbi:hypothetical protein I317_02241 [Kwoniella heveanensis CBS 569]|nr:hypothetical protein I317_02241 [Kwoniella heveanensis CBS 569]
MSAYETVTAGRAKRSTAGNRMRELLEKAHQEDEDELFAEVEDDEDFTAPQEQRDVFLDEFADTDEEVEEDEEATEKALQREERKKAKGKSKAIYNPLANQPKSKKAAEPTVSSLTETDLALLDPALDPSSMAPSTLMLALRRKRREVKRLGRSEARRSNLRASTLKTEEEIKAREAAEKAARGNKGRRPQHETGEVRGQRRMTQDELIAAALEEEERNKEALRDWLKKEDEKRELRRVGRKRVKGPRWTWVSRTVNRLVEVVEAEKKAEEGKTASKSAASTTAPENKADGQKVEQQKDEAATGPEIVKAVAVAKHDTLDSSITGSTTLAQIESQNTEVPVDGNVSSPQVEATQASPSGQVSALTASTAALPSTPLVGTATDPEPGQTDGAADVNVSGTPGTGAPTDPIARPSDRITTDGIKDQNTEPAPLPSTGTTVEPHAVPASPTHATGDDSSTAVPRKVPTQTEITANAEAGPSKQPAVAGSSGPTTAGSSDRVVQTLSGTKQAAEPAPVDETSQYTRNYLILSQVPGGLPAELKIVLGDHVEWEEVTYIPARNRPIVRRPPICPFTGLPAKYRHPTTMIPYANAEGYKSIEALLANRYMYDQGGWWLGGEEDVHAERVDEVEGWWEATNGGWLGGHVIPSEPESEPEPVPAPEPEVVAEAGDEEVAGAEEQFEVGPKGKGKRKRGKGSESVSATPEVASKKAKGKKGKVKVEIVEPEPEFVPDPEPEVVDTPVPASKKSKSKVKKK